MLYSSRRKREISGWLKENHSHEFSSSLKLQKFLFFYEILSKIENDECELDSLKGYMNGPVFSDVYGDYTYRTDEFEADVETAYQHASNVDEDIAKFTGFLVSILNQEELSEITHELNIWKSKEELISSGAKQVPLLEKDFTKEDEDLLYSLRAMYPTEYIDSVQVIEISGKSFVISKEDVKKLTEDQERVFITLADDDSLENPVYVSVSEDGVVLID